MSSTEVREALKARVEAVALPWPVFDLSDYRSLEDALPQHSSNAVLLQYVVATEDLVTIGGEGNQGWEESGTVVIHLVSRSGQVATPEVAKGDEIRKALRGTRLTNQLTIESCEPFSDFGLAAGLYGGLWKGWAANLYYRNRTCG